MMKRFLYAMLILRALSAYAAEIDPEKIKFFEMKVRPLLSEKCHKCHGDQKQKGTLRLDSLAAILKGGETSPAIVLGKPEDSLLIKAVAYSDPDMQMPPKATEQLSKDQVETLAQWIKMGAPWPVEKIVEKKQKAITDADRAFWSFQPVKEIVPPHSDDGNWSKNPIDRFIFAKLASEQLAPAPEAARVALVRRVYFDLHGLPPTPDEVDAFVKDNSADAYEKLIDKLLASPRYGERWARHWLDLVRYAESDGFRQDAFRPHAWPYRDYVIKSFNADKPYDRFVTEQLAGDELAPDDPDVLVATGYMRHGQYEYNQRDVSKQWSEILNDITDTTGDVFLGLSMGCARCHDHKFDPILQADYFKLQSFFGATLPRNDLSLVTAKQQAEHQAQLQKWEAKTASIREQIAALEKLQSEKVTKSAIDKFLPEYQVMLRKPVAERVPYEQQIAELAFRQVTHELDNLDGKIKGPEREKWAALKRQLAEFDELKPKPMPPAFVTTDVGPLAPPTTIPGQKKVLEPGVLTVLQSQPIPFDPPVATATSTGRRTALAKWITHPQNPLASRVMVNRLWQYHFGRGLVVTSSDYGRLGEQPSHPALLDWLAREFVQKGWSIKQMHRLIMTSSTYKQSATRPMPQQARLKDPENRWLWRMNSRRLDAEQIRDAMLAVSGELNAASGGPSADSTSTRRTIYTKIIRNTRDPLMDAFDAPDAFGSAPNRSTTTTPTQALLLINGTWPMQRAVALAEKIKQTKANTPEEIVENAYRLAYGRAPLDAERSAALAFLAKQPEKPAGAPAARLEALAEKPPTQTMPHRGGQAAMLSGAPEDFLRLPESATLPSDDFTIEAVVLLESIYDNAAVRVIASQWDGGQKNPGWSFGVTSEKSKHQPRNLILQLAGNAAAGDGVQYEVVVSDLRLELHKTHYVAVSVKISETGETGVTFYMKDLSDPDAQLRVASVKHKVNGAYQSKVPLIIGGREGSGGVHVWDGLIDDIRLSNKSVPREQLLISETENKAIVADFRFEDEPGFAKDSSGKQKDLARSASAKTAAQPAHTPKPSGGLVDFCHVLLNSNEFLYVD